MSVPFSALQIQTTLPQSIIDRQSDVNLRTAALAVFAVFNPTFDISEGSDAWALLSPFAIVLSEAYSDLVEIERRTSLAFATGTSLDLLGELYGVPRGPASYASGTVTITGTPGSLIPVGLSISTQGVQPQFFQYLGTQALTIPTSGLLQVPVRAMATGAAGNVAAGAITLFGTPVPAGLQAVTNAAAFTGGADIQPDGPTGQLQTGYRGDIAQLMDARGEGGAAKHYRKWARQVPGVGGVVVLETTPRPGWVTIALLGNDGQPADGAVVKAVEQYILDPWYLTYEAEDLPNTGTPSSEPDGTPAGASNNAVALGSGAAITHPELETTLPQPGIWRLKPRLKGAGTVEYGAWNLTINAWATTRPMGLGDPAVHTATVANGTFIDPALDIWGDFAWDGMTERIEARVTCTGGNVTCDQVGYWATMSRADRDLGLAPAGARLLVKPADAVTVDVSAHVTYALVSGQSEQSVDDLIRQNLTAFFAGIAFSSEVGSIRRAAVENVIFTTSGVSDVSNVLLNGTADNVVYAPDAVAVLGQLTFT